MIRWEDLLALLQKLLPKQKMRDVGDGNVQVGQSASVHIQHTHHYYASNAVAAPAEKPSAMGSRKATAEQREVLMLIAGDAPWRNAVLDFAEKAYKTRMIVDVHSPKALYRIKKYALACKRNHETQKEGE